MNRARHFPPPVGGSGSSLGKEVQCTRFLGSRQVDCVRFPGLNALNFPSNSPSTLGVFVNPNQSAPSDGPSQTAPTDPIGSWWGGWPRFIITRVVVWYLIIVVIMLFLENWMIYQPFPGRSSPPPPGLEFEDVFFESIDGTRLHGWYAPHPEARAQVIYAHGNAGDLTHRGTMIQQLRDRFRVGVFLFDYRGYGQSGGSPSEAGLLMDGRAARDWLAQRAGIAPNEVVLMGRSLGTGVVVDLAANDGAGGLILQAPFTSLPDIAARQFPWLPVRMLMRNRFDSLAKIGQYQGPLLIGHGERDELTPVAMAERLYEAANEPKRLVIIAGAMHNDPFGGDFPEALEQFFSELE